MSSVEGSSNGAMGETNFGLFCSCQNFQKADSWNDFADFQAES